MASNSNKSRCDRCKNETTLLEFGDMRICSECYLVLNPPALHLSRYEGDIDLWNKTQSKREIAMDLRDFERCGWFLRKVKEFKRKVPRYSREEMYLEYYGKYKCTRFIGYYDKLSLKDLDNCKKPHGSCQRNIIMH